MKMRNYVYLAVLLLLFVSPIFGFDEQQDLKDELVDIIKSQYKSEESSDLQNANKHLTSQKTSNANLGIPTQGNVQMMQVKTSGVFSLFSDEGLDLSKFDFTITHNQAVVRFVMNHQMKSAFFEKKGDQWKLVMIADLPEMLF